MKTENDYFDLIARIYAAAAELGMTYITYMRVDTKNITVPRDDNAFWGEMMEAALCAAQVRMEEEGIHACIRSLVLAN